MIMTFIWAPIHHLRCQISVFVSSDVPGKHLLKYIFNQSRSFLFVWFCRGGVFLYWVE
jgi:hypothetical protein